MEEVQNEGDHAGSEVTATDSNNIHKLAVLHQMICLLIVAHCYRKVQTHVEICSIEQGRNDHLTAI